MYPRFLALHQENCQKFSAPEWPPSFFWRPETIDANDPEASENISSFMYIITHDDITRSL